jgi:MFS family permease
MLGKVDNHMANSIWRELLKKKQFRYSILLMMFYAGFVLSMDTYKVAALAPFWSSELAMTADQIGKILASTNLGLIPMLLFAGILSDWWGAKKIAFIAVLFGSIISGHMAFAVSFDQMYYRNILVGLCFGAIVPGALRLISQWFPAQDVDGASAIFYSGLLASGVLGTPIAIFIANHFGWQFAFLFIAAVGIPCAFWILFGATEQPEDKKGITSEELSYIQAGRVEVTKPTFREFVRAVSSNKRVIIIVFAAGIPTAANFLVQWIWTATMMHAGINADLVALVVPILLAIPALYGFIHGTVSRRVFKGNLRLLMAFGGLLAAVGSFAAAFLTSAPWWLWAFLIIVPGSLTNYFISSSAPAYYLSTVGPRFVGTLVGANAFVSGVFSWYLLNESGKWVDTTAIGLARTQLIWIVAGFVYLVPVVLVWFAKKVIVRGQVRPEDEGPAP